MTNSPGTLNLRCEESEWISADGVRLHRRLWTSPAENVAEGSHSADRSQRSVIVVVHGYGDHSGRYDELAGALVSRGNWVLAYDCRGHGKSGGQRGYIRDFRESVNDLQELLQWARDRFPTQRLALLGHSNGGLTALRTVQQGVDGVSAVVLLAPLIRLPASRKVIPDWLARGLSAALPRLPAPNGIKPQDLTRDPYWQDRTAQDPLCLRVATARWYWQATLAGRQALVDAQRVQLPLLVITGADDNLVDPSGSVELVQSIDSPAARLLVREGELHEVLNERKREEVFEILGQWFAEKLSRAPSGSQESSCETFD